MTDRKAKSTNKTKDRADQKNIEDQKQKQNDFYKEALTSFRSVAGTIIVQVLALNKIKMDNQANGFKADNNVESIVENFKNSGGNSLKDTIEIMNTQNMSLTGREAVLKLLKIPENVISFIKSTDVASHFLELVLGIQPIGSNQNEDKVNNYMKDNQKTLALEKQNNMDLNNIIPKVKNFNENSSKEPVFSIDRFENFTKQGQINNTNELGASQIVEVDFSGGENMHYTSPVNWFNVSFFAIFFVCLTSVSFQLFKKLFSE